jgi:hypothetical protein
MSKEKQGKEVGPIHTGTEFIPGDHKEFSSTGGGDYNGIAGEPYPKGTPTKLPELAFDNSGEFGKIKKTEE